MIVIGVLIALGADAAWEKRQESALERFYLTSIVAEVAHATAALDSTITVVTDLQRRNDDFLAVLETGGPEPDSLDRSSFRLVPMSVTLAALETLVEAGDLRLVKDERLRARLMTTQSSFKNSRRIYDQLDVSFWLNFNNYLTAATQVRSEHGLRSGNPIPAALIRENPAVLAAWAQQQAYYRNSLFTLNAVKASLDRLDEALAGIPGS